MLKIKIYSEFKLLLANGETSRFSIKKSCENDQFFLARPLNCLILMLVVYLPTLDSRLWAMTIDDPIDPI